jgi:DNA polymerase III subunit gamma/tau
MSYLVLARKWRPRRFGELVGQQHVVRALVNGIETGRLHHAFLFTGTRGVGKTTIARILAKALNCERGVGSEPCGECSTCLDIDAGRYVDLLEIDAASRTKVDDTREILDNVIYAPARGRYKVYLIDEVHMLSTSSFNALLKTLEEPPPHVKFLLATTDPQKLPVTVLSRCLQFSLKRLSRIEIEGQIRRILEAEGVAFEDAAVALVARAAEGSLRDALSLLDQAIAFGGGAVHHAEVAEMLGTIDRKALAALAKALAHEDRAALRTELARIGGLSVDYPGLLAELLALWHEVASRQAFGEDIESRFVDEPVLAELAERLAPELVQLFYQLSLQARRDIDLAPDHRTGFEMAMLRLLAFQPADTATAPPTPVGGPVRSQPSLPPAGGPGGIPSRPSASPAPAQPPAQPVVATPVPGARPVQPPAASGIAEGGPADGWFGLVARAGLRGPALALAQQLRPIDCVDGLWRVALPPVLDGLATPLARRELENAVVATGARLEIVLRAVEGETWAEREARSRGERAQVAERKLMSDPAVAGVIREFDASMVPGSLRLDS